MQQGIKVVAVNKVKDHPYVVESIADALERLIKSRLATGQYVVVNGVIEKATKSE